MKLTGPKENAAVLFFQKLQIDCIISSPKVEQLHDSACRQTIQCGQKRKRGAPSKAKKALVVQ